MRKFTDAEKAILFLDGFRELEYKYKKAFLDEVGDGVADILSSPNILSSFFEEIGNEKYAATLSLACGEKGFPEKLIAASLKHADDAVTLFSEDYPERLANISAPPLVLYCRGNTELLRSENAVSIVGSRKMLSSYLVKTKEIAEEISSAGVTVVTGIAEGGDRAAIDGALKSGNLISVLPGGLDCVYPAFHASLTDKIAESGLVCSEYRAGTIPRNYMFPVRNRIIAGLGDGVLVTGGGEKSGVRHTAEFALDYGREVWCLPYGLGVSSGRLPIDLVKNGAGIAESGEEILFALGIEEKSGSSSFQPETTEEEDAVLALLAEGGSSLDRLIESSGIPVQDLLTILGMLELKGLCVKEGDGYRCLAKGK